MKREKAITGGSRGIGPSVLLHTSSLKGLVAGKGLDGETNGDFLRR
jgi:hypothetical protein